MFHGWHFLCWTVRKYIQITVFKLMHLFPKHSGWYFVLTITKVCQAFYGRVPNGPAYSLYPSMHVRDKVTTTENSRYPKNIFRMFSCFLLTQFVNVDILQNSSVMKFVWGETNAGYTVLTTTKIELWVNVWEILKHHLFLS